MTIWVRAAMLCMVVTLTLVPNLSSSCGRSSPSCFGAATSQP